MWYAVSLLYKSVHVPAESKETLWEERILLMQTETEAEARDQAEKMARSGEHAYDVEDGFVTWTFEQIESVFSIRDEELRSGSEVFSRFLRDSEVKSLLTPFD
jgi:hypothetical protein